MLRFENRIVLILCLIGLSLNRAILYQAFLRIPLFITLESIIDVRQHSVAINLNAWIVETHLIFYSTPSLLT